MAGHKEKTTITKMIEHNKKLMGKVNKQLNLMGRVPTKSNTKPKSKPKVKNSGCGCG